MEDGARSEPPSNVGPALYSLVEMRISIAGARNSSRRFRWADTATRTISGALARFCCRMRRPTSPAPRSRSDGGFTAIRTRWSRRRRHRVADEARPIPAVQRFLNRRRKLDILRLRLPRTAGRPAEDAGRPDAGKEQSLERLIAFDQRTIHLSGSGQHHHEHEDTGARLACATEKWTGNPITNHSSLNPRIES